MLIKSHSRKIPKKFDTINMILKHLSNHLTLSKKDMNYLQEFLDMRDMIIKYTEICDEKVMDFNYLILQHQTSLTYLQNKYVRDKTTELVAAKLY